MQQQQQHQDDGNSDDNKTAANKFHYNEFFGFAFLQLNLVPLFLAYNLCAAAKSCQLQAPDKADSSP